MWRLRSATSETNAMVAIATASIHVDLSLISVFGANGAKILTFHAVRSAWQDGMEQALGVPGAYNDGRVTCCGSLRSHEQRHSPVRRGFGRSQPVRQWDLSGFSCCYACAGC